MDRHRRQFTFRQLPVWQTGPSCHADFSHFTVTPAHVIGMNARALRRSHTWNF
ncbi:protein YoaL [Yokenella regensburgei]|uniref:protein YoaL n=1 Tax=Yokenella regensburgei TaxID=158877 RepID=UPI0035A38A2E